MNRNADLIWIWRHVVLPTLRYFLFGYCTHPFITSRHCNYFIVVHFRRYLHKPDERVSSVVQHPALQLELVINCAVDIGPMREYAMLVPLLDLDLVGFEEWLVHPDDQLAIPVDHGSQEPQCLDLAPTSLLLRHHSVELAQVFLVARDCA